ncbi:oxidoreductase [Aureococcus anophagefferens]|nr:oxidoreductase [Aureococcus anophagefferens]
MAWGRLRKKVRYEVRKGLHTAGALAMGIAVALHAPKSVVAYVVGPALAVYAADVLYQVFALTFHIETTVFHRLERGVQLSFENPPGFRADAVGYVYVMIPWIAKDQWHAFSLYQSPEHPGYSSVPYATASNFDNLVLVASGIGITPAINILAAAKETRRCNLLWMCRDASLVEFYLSAVEFDDDGYTVVYYTGKRELCVDTSRLPARVLVFAKRPNLPRAIQGLIHAIETGTGLPEDAVQASEEAKARASDAHRRQSEPGDAPMDRFAAASHESSKNSVSAADIFGEAGVDVDREAFFDACGARLSRWEILDCGGAQPVVDALTKFSREFFISFRKEKFDW